MPNQFPTTSKTLIDRIKSGDEISWDEFYQRYSGIILFLAKYKGLNDTEADDVRQQVILEFFKQSKTFRFDPDIARFRTYFGRIINAKIADHYRKRRDNVEFGDHDVPDENVSFESEEDLVFMTEWRKAVLNDIQTQLKQRISADTWLAFELYALQDRPVEKVAAYLDCSVNQVYQAKKRCFAMLREIIEDLNKRDPELKLELLNHGL